MRYQFTVCANGYSERSQIDTHLNGPKWKSVVEELDQYLRNRIKYTESFKSGDEELQDVRDRLWQELGDEGLKLLD